MKSLTRLLLGVSCLVLGALPILGFALSHSHTCDGGPCAAKAAYEAAAKKESELHQRALKELPRTKRPAGMPAEWLHAIQDLRSTKGFKSIAELGNSKFDKDV